jgi:serine O-acetyltransferase
MKELISMLIEDLNQITKVGLFRKLLTIWFNMSFRLIINYRLGNFLNSRRNIITNIIILWLKKRQINRYACDISYQAQIGRRIKFPHPIGIVIGVGSVIENDVMIWQNVTLGSKGNMDKCYPHISNGVKLFSSSQVLGGIIIGENAIIGASSIVLNNIPANKTAVGIPAKII